MGTKRSPDDATDRRYQLEALAEAAVSCRPRLFAIHGLYRRQGFGNILGWGLEFPEDKTAIFTDPTDGSFHQSSSAERVFQVMSIIGEVQLTWLDDG